MEYRIQQKEGIMKGLNESMKQKEEEIKQMKDKMVDSEQLVAAYQSDKNAFRMSIEQMEVM